MKFETFTAALAPAVVRFWNRSSRHDPNFLPLTARAFRDRVLRQEHFDADGFIVARSPRDVAGVIHVGRRGRPALDTPALPEGQHGAPRRRPEATPASQGQGVVAFFWVDPAHRRKGVGTRLWHAGLEWARRAGQVVVLNPWENPYYGADETRRSLWGPWGPGVAWRDSATLKFLARKGYAPQSRALQLALEVEGKKSRRKDREVRLPPGGMKETVRAWVARMKRAGGGRAEALSFPDLRPEEHGSFVAAGFQTVAAWAIF